MIIFLNGASSSGKTSLARVLQTRWQDYAKMPLLYVSLDSVISQLPIAYTGSGEFSATGFPLVEQRSKGLDVATIAVGAVGYRLNSVVAKYVRLLADSEFDLVVDYVLLDAQLLQAFIDELGAHPLCFVGLTCSAQVLAGRERGRGDRALGLALGQHKAVHFCASRYDLEVDSAQTTAQRMAELVMTHIEQMPQRLGFKPE